MALRDRWVRRNIEKVRERLLINPDDDLADIIQGMDQDDVRYKEQCRLKILRNFLVYSLFDGRHDAAKRALVKIIALKPPYKPVSPEKANELMLVLWQSASVSRADLDLLIGELGKMDKPVGASEDELPFL